MTSRLLSFSALFTELWAMEEAAHFDLQRAFLQPAEPHAEARRRGVLCSEMGDYSGSDIERGNFIRVGSVAIIPIEGIISKDCSDGEVDYFGACDLDDIASALDLAENDDSIETILFAIKSPGGLVTGFIELADLIFECEKETVAFCWQAGSAAYWLASQCDAVYVPRSGRVGSIGAYIVLLDQTKMNAELGLKYNAISDGQYKLSGASFQPLSDEDRARFQTNVTKGSNQFKSCVTRCRSISPEAMQGQSFDGEEAALAGLSDGVFDSIEDVLETL
jgi:ClpP class serine protease